MDRRHAPQKLKSRPRVQENAEVQNLVAHALERTQAHKCCWASRTAAAFTRSRSTPAFLAAISFLTRAAPPPPLPTPRHGEAVFTTEQAPPPAHSLSLLGTDTGGGAATPAGTNASTSSASTSFSHRRNLRVNKPCHTRTQYCTHAAHMRSDPSSGTRCVFRELKKAAHASFGHRISRTYNGPWASPAMRTLLCANTHQHAVAEQLRHCLVLRIFPQLHHGHSSVHATFRRHFAPAHTCEFVLSTQTQGTPWARALKKRSIHHSWALP